MAWAGSTVMKIKRSGVISVEQKWIELCYWLNRCKGQESFRLTPTFLACLTVWLMENQVGKLYVQFWRGGWEVRGDIYIYYFIHTIILESEFPTKGKRVIFLESGRPKLKFCLLKQLLSHWLIAKYLTLVFLCPHLKNEENTGLAKLVWEIMK